MMSNKKQAMALVKNAVHARRAAARHAVLEKDAAGLPTMAAEALSSLAREALRRGAVRLHPRVSNPTVLKWLKPFIKSKSVRTKLKGTPAEVENAMARAYRAMLGGAGGAGGAGGEAVGGISGSVSGAIPQGASGAQEIGNIARMIANGATYRNVEKSRLNIPRLAAAVGGTTALAGGAAKLMSGKKDDAGGAQALPAGTPGQASAKLDYVKALLMSLWNDQDARNAIIGAGVGGLGAAALTKGDINDRLVNGLIGAAIGGGGTYAASRLYNNRAQRGNLGI